MKDNSSSDDDMDSRVPVNDIVPEHPLQHQEGEATHCSFRLCPDALDCAVVILGIFLLLLFL